MGEFVIRIPRVSVAVSDAELVDLLVEGGKHVAKGTPCLARRQEHTGVLNAPFGINY